MLISNPSEIINTVEGYVEYFLTQREHMPTAIQNQIINALFQNPIMAVYAAIIILIAQQIEGNLITPNVIGNGLSVHPLTVITLVLAAGRGLPSRDLQDSPQLK
ncbi:AI-2E family transporter [Jeotgalicoccus halotolerans]|uniref:Uncharacterized protein DUF20 n=1 Tax=Jeotgalicoccus halotolerans TaxID=157227 RepID=A0A3E0B346_9STAP|nr:AI-2E family transporter [Jeotgalicoccus halotolerans]REG26393.1 uncharacterized protein DUF20 [Jeotgalicoccus halotolerans]